MEHHLSDFKILFFKVTVQLFIYVYFFIYVLKLVATFFEVNKIEIN